MRSIALCFAILFLSACATRPYEGVQVDAASFLERSISQEEGSLVITAAVPDAAETLALTGLDLYEQGIQPVWLKVENRGDTRARVVHWSIDRNYFSPIEVAYMNRKKFSSEGYEDMQRWFYDNALPRFIPAGETRTGLVFTNLMRGSKGFNLTAIQDRDTHDFTFFVPMPGFTADFMEVDFANLYSEDEILDVDLLALKHALETELPCCATDPTGELDGGPLNAVLVGTGPAVRRTMLRGQWLETASGEEVVPKARQQHYRGRPPDAIFMQQRGDGNERVQLHLWMSPWRVQGEPVWVGQVYYFIEDKGLLSALDDQTIKDFALLSYFVQESVMADLDSAQRFLLQNVWYNGSLKMAGFVEGVGEVTIENPHEGFGGAIFFTDGWRTVLVLSEEPMALDEAEIRFDARRRRAQEEGGQ
jgi:hypothetical protein